MEANEVALIIASVSGLIVAVAGVFMKYLTAITKADRAERIETMKCNAKANEMLALALNKNTASNEQIAKETKKAADEARERNGHLAELQLKSQKMIDRNFEAYKEMNKQHIKIQEIDEQRVRERKAIRTEEK